jgi:hypothetical protein
VEAFRQAVADGDDWFPALLGTIARWELPDEEVDGRRYCYLIGGEAFDWLLLAERLCSELDGAIPSAEREALLFFGRPPQAMDDAEFRRAIGDAKHRAHLNFLYGVAVEEALQLIVEEEVLKEHRSSVWNGNGNIGRDVFERIYGRTEDDLLAEYRASRALPDSDELSYGDLRSFTYWLFKYRVSQSDPARVASDTRKALAQVAQLENALRRRMEFLASNRVNGAAVVDGEVVAHLR